MSVRITWEAYLKKKKRIPEPHPPKTLIRRTVVGPRKVYFYSKPHATPR